MDSVLRPRDIQTRIRAGETPEAVAAAAKTTVDKIMAFAAPVLAEREHVAQRAQRSSVRRKTGDGDGPRHAAGPSATRSPATCGRSRLPRDGIVGLLPSRGRPLGADGRLRDATRKGAARFAFDAPGNFVVTENDDARWLIGDLADTPQPRARARAAGPQRRLSAVPSEELPLGDDAIELVRDPDAADEPTIVEPADELPPVRTVDLTDTAAKVRAVRRSPAARGQPSFLDSVLQEDDAAADDGGGAEEPASRPPKRPARKKGARASVPSWDEIMFGGGKTRVTRRPGPPGPASAALDRPGRVGDPAGPAAG